jgi:hypothetical protein
MKMSVRSLRTGFPLAECPIVIMILPSVQDGVTKVTRLEKFGCFMTAFATSCATGIIKPNQLRTLFGVIKYVVRRGFPWVD